MIRQEMRQEQEGNLGSDLELLVQLTQLKVSPKQILTSGGLTYNVVKSTVHSLLRRAFCACVRKCATRAFFLRTFAQMCREAVLFAHVCAKEPRGRFFLYLNAHERISFNSIAVPSGNPSGTRQ